LIHRREVGVSVNEVPLSLDPAIDVGDADCHRRDGTSIHDNFASFEPNRVGQVSALEGNDVLRYQRSALEATPDPAERLAEAGETSFDGPPRPEESSVF
jgi:hypothetical protein